VDNPGWSLQVDLKDTTLEHMTLEYTKIDIEHETDWMSFKVENQMFIAYGGPKQLSAMIEYFLNWARG
jgi:hypothetical protein